MRRPDFDDPDLLLSDLFTEWPETAGAFLERRMLCPGCPLAPFHTVVDACQEYDLEEAAFRAELRRRVMPPETVRRRSAGPGRAGR